MNESEGLLAGQVDLRPVLDDAMHELSDRDRTAVLLRYFERLPLAEIGLRLGISENTASKVVERALDRLRHCFAKRGLSSTSAVLATALANQAVVAAPAGFASTVTASLLTTGASGAAAIASLVFMSKTTCAALIAGVVVASGVSLLQFNRGAVFAAEVDSLRRDNARLTDQARAIASTVSSANAELEVRRKENRALAALPVPSPAAPDVAPPPSPAIQILGNLSNVGRATPVAALETYFWAISTGDAKAIGDCIHFESADHEALRELFSTLSARAQAYFESPETMLAAATASLMPTVARVEIVDTVLRSTGETRIRYRRNDDTTVRSVSLFYAQEGWKIVGQGQYPDDPEKQATLKFVAESIAANARR